MNYDKIGFKAGLEIHQQLDTGKLFSRTPSFLRKDEPHFSIQRKLHPVAGETGELDAAVKHEAALKKNFVYQGYNDTISLVELDEAPPQEIDKNALEETIKIALLLNCAIYPVAQIMRKTVIDGSNTSGFQRTVLIAHDGFLETSFGPVGIETIVLEEDSARLISRDDKNAIYRLDRLGIPLIEIATAPTLKNAEHIKETALKIGEILRSCRVKRGLGTIRQDVNISIKEHLRVEIKGFQDVRMMVETINNEIKRQQENIKKGKKEGDVRNALADGKTEFLRPMPGRDRMYPETDLPLLKIGREQINSVKKILPKLKSEIKAELEKKGLSAELIDIVIDEHLDEFVTLMKVYSRDANLVGKMVSLWRTELSTKLKISDDEVINRLNERTLEEILEAVRDKKISEGDVRSVMEKIARGSTLKEALKIERISDDELEEEIAKLIREKPGLQPNAYMGLVIAKFKGKVDAKKAMEILQRIVKS